jgi:hypothetical protein
MIDAIPNPSAHTDDAPVGNSDVEPAAVRAQHTRRLNPPLDCSLINIELLIDPNRPWLADAKRSPFPPDIGDPVSRHPLRLPRTAILQTLQLARLDGVVECLGRVNADRAVDTSIIEQKKLRNGGLPGTDALKHGGTMY